jgi:hypothetical protein
MPHITACACAAQIAARQARREQLEAFRAAGSRLTPFETRAGQLLVRMHRAPPTTVTPAVDVEAPAPLAPARMPAASSAAAAGQAVGVV